MRASRLIGLIYEAVVEPDAWNPFLEELSSQLDGAAIHLSLRLPDSVPSPDAIYQVGLDVRYYPVFVKHVLEGLPWGSLADDVFRDRFSSAGDVEKTPDPLDSPFYREFMQPQGLAAEWPLGHMIHREGRVPLAGILIYRRETGRAIDAEDLALLDSLVPHLDRAYQIHRQLDRVRHEREALTEVIDRLPTGVILFDGAGKVVLMNRSAEQILALDDGLRIERGRLTAGSPRENQALQTHLAAVVTQSGSHGRPTGDVMAVTRPSGRRSFGLMLNPLVAPASGRRIDAARGVVFVADPEGVQVSTTAILETLYQLTHAEAELVRMIAEGHSLDEVAASRGVTLNTVRSQMKQVFSKTDTNRQGELVHLVLSGVGALRDGESD